MITTRKTDMINIFKRHTIVPVPLDEKSRELPDNSVLSLFQNKTPSAKLYFGSQYDSKGLTRLKDIGITAIVNMRSQMVFQDEAHSQFKYLHLPTPDNNPPTLEMMINGAAFIDAEISNGGKVYVNCLKGHGRGPAMVIAYLIQTGKTFEEAHDYILNLKPEVKINVLQVMRLKELENHYKDALKRELSY
jgi:protein-tyrosine phosphatase